MDQIDKAAMDDVEGRGSRSNIHFMNSTVKKVIRAAIRDGKCLTQSSD